MTDAQAWPFLITFFYTLQHISHFNC
jgi:hypothetical protein